MDKDSELSISPLNKNPPSKQRGYNRQRRIWSTFNQIRIVYRVGHLMHKWGITPNPGCESNAPNQNIEHSVRGCPKRKFNGELKDILNVTPEFCVIIFILS